MRYICSKYPLLIAIHIFCPNKIYAFYLHNKYTNLRNRYLLSCLVLIALLFIVNPIILKNIKFIYFINAIMHL